MSDDRKMKTTAKGAFPTGADLLHDPTLNKGTAFTEAERDAFGLRGLLPPRVCTQDVQVQRVMQNYRLKATDLERFIHMVSLQDRNETGRVQRPVAGLVMFSAIPRQVYRHRFVSQPLQIEGDPHAISGRAAEIGMELHASLPMSLSTVPKSLRSSPPPPRRVRSRGRSATGSRSPWTREVPRRSRTTRGATSRTTPS